MAHVAKAVGFRQASSYQRYEDPALYRKDTLSLPLARKLADIFEGKGSPPVRREEILMLAGIAELTPNQVISLDQHQIIWCIGEVVADVWRDTLEWPRTEWLPFLISFADERYPGAPRYSMRVRGDSMDELYPSGSFIIFVKTAEISSKPQPGDRVVVVRRREGKMEVTAKELRQAQDRLWLIPRSSNPKHESLPAPPTPQNGEQLEIIGLIVGSQRIE